MSTVAAVRALPGGEFASPSAVSSEAIQSALDLATGFLDPTAWGVSYPRGLALLAGHILKAMTPSLGGDTAAVGPVTARSAGDVSETRAVSARMTSDASLSGTVYGSLYLDLRDSLAARAPTFIGIL